MHQSIYLINPRESVLGYHGMEVLRAWNVADVTNLADLSTTTVAALVPQGWEISLCDERMQPVDFDTKAAVIGLTGKISQRERVIELAAEFRRRGKLVVIGGPAASLAPDEFRAHADILVTGELEEIAAGLFADIAANGWKQHYEGGRPDLKSSPVPRWDLYPRGQSLNGQIQTSRGCPFECEFCDVIQYLGRKQRWKEPGQVLRELDVLYVRGFRHVFLADDNFTVMRRRTRALLERLEAWNDARLAGRVEFSTQVSIDIARDPELLAHCARAGVRTVFIGIETPNEASLAETMKRQNLRIDLAKEVCTVTRAGIMVMCGIIVGFDHDGPDIFERQVRFIQSLPVPMVHFGTLVAPASTPLYARLQAEGRLTNLSHVAGGNFFQTNIVPKLMSQEELLAGARWLLNHIYSPAAFAQRLVSFARICGRRDKAVQSPGFGSIERALAQRLASMGEEERKLLALFEQLAKSRPDIVGHLAYFLLGYCQARYIFERYGVWDPELVRRDTPLAA
jgi:hypothetical protein